MICAGVILDVRNMRMVNLESTARNYWKLGSLVPVVRSLIVQPQNERPACLSHLGMVAILQLPRKNAEIGSAENPDAQGMKRKLHRRLTH